MALEINQKEVAPGMVAISLEGSVMRGPEGERIETVLNGLLAQGLRRVVFDMAGVKRIDSTGIGRFIYCLNKIQENGGRLWMAGAQGYVRECFRVTRLDTIFQFCGSVEDALAANQGG
ncbi:MAG TPA: STAS domain-containing protein [Bryobacteraceae bacterium]|nr:STAS domain-containing protein [Bryobacteraceae bacterium]